MLTARPVITRRLVLVAIILTAFLLLTGCGETEPTPDLAQPTLPPGYQAELVATGLDGPTQMLIGPDGWLWLAQLAGPEDAGHGQVISLSMETGERRTLLEGLFKPTGLAVLDGGLWIASGPDLLRAPLMGGGVGAAETVLVDLPFNGRSNGTLTVTPSGRLLYETSGRREGNRAVEGSAILWEFNPIDPTHPRPIATGLKGAYAHVFDADGRLWTTEIGNDPVNGKPPPDELNLVAEGADFGWPQCYGDRQPAFNYGGDEQKCRVTRAPVALFPAGSTPTSVVVSPWEEDTLLVALWAPSGQGVVRVRFTVEGDNAAGQVEPFVSGMEHPQHLLVLEDGSLLMSDFGTGTIYRISRSSQ